MTLTSLFRLPCKFFFLVLSALLLSLPTAHAAEPRLLLSSSTILPGETLRVELDDASPTDHLKAVFMNKTYRFFVVGPNAQRALIGVPLGASAGTFDLKVRSAGRTANLAATSVTVASRTYTVENVNFTAEKTELMRWEHRESVLIHKTALIDSAEQSWEGTFSPPVEGPVIGEFGLKRIRNGTIDAGFHKGVDLRAAAGTPVLASNGGLVRIAAVLKTHGRTVLIDHGQGVMSIYLHMSSILVKSGQRVSKGQVIGKVGSTGLSTAPHVHWEILVHSVPVDPTPWTDTEF